MPPRSTVKKLPPEIKAELDRLLVLDNFTIDQLAAELRALGANVSRSAVGRYSKNYKQVAAKMKEYKQMATAFAGELGTEVESDSHKVIVQMLHTMMVRVGMKDLESDEPTMDAKEMMFFANTLKSVMGSVKDRQVIQEKAREKALAEAADAATSVAKRKGLTRETVKAIRDKILGG